MKSIRVKDFGSFEHVALVEEKTPEPSDYEVLIEVKACGLNYRDLAIIKKKGTLSPKPNLIPVSDGAGEVVKTGKKVTRFKIGDRVAGAFFQHWQSGEQTLDNSRGAWGADEDGWLTEFKSIHENSVVKIPEHLSYEEAASLPCSAVTAWSSLTKPHPLLPGQTLLLQGTGDVSLSALQLAKLFNLRVIALTSTEEKETLLKSMGADHVINYRAVTEWSQEVLQLTDNRGVDRVVEVAGPATFLNSLRSCCPEGQIMVIGFASRKTEQELTYMDIYRGGAAVIPMDVGSRTDFESMNRAISHAKLKPKVNKVFAFDEVIEALQYMENGAGIGKTVIRVS